MYEKQHRDDLGPILPFWKKENVETEPCTDNDVGGLTNILHLHVCI
jgi:hypothetical protein